LGSIRASPTGSVKFTPSSDSSKTGNPTGSFRLSPVSATPTVLYPGTPSPMPMSYGNNLNFGVNAQDVRSPPPTTVTQTTGSPQTLQQAQPTQVVYMQPQTAAHMPVMMQPGHMPVVMQAPYPSDGGVMVQAPQQAMQSVVMVPQQVQAVQTHSPGGTANSPGQVVAGDVMHGGLVQMPGVAPQVYGDSPESAGTATAAAEAMAPVSTAVAGALPSVGSALHDGTGRCSPCAWFWKPRGCQSGATCGYCHLCPEGELKNRKKAKVQAIRMGAIEPATRPQHGTAQQNRASLKLTTLL